MPDARWAKPSLIDVTNSLRDGLFTFSLPSARSARRSGGYARIELLLIERAGEALERWTAAGGNDDAPPSGEEVTMAEALSLLRLGQRQKERFGQRGAPPVRVATQEESIAALAKRLAVFGRRVMAEKAAGGSISDSGVADAE